MKFKELIEKVDIEVAVIVEENLPAGFWDEITLEKCSLIYEKVPYDSELAETILSKIMEKEGNFSEWFNVYKHGSCGSEIRKFALGKMMEKGILVEWSKIYKQTLNENELKETSLKRLKEIYKS
jgi:hypothetical protein